MMSLVWLEGGGKEGGRWSFRGSGVVRRRGGRFSGVAVVAATIDRSSTLGGDRQK